jgi:hypothetical protein
MVVKKREGDKTPSRFSFVWLEFGGKRTHIAKVRWEISVRRLCETEFH